MRRSLKYFLFVVMQLHVSTVANGHFQEKQDKPLRLQDTKKHQNTETSVQRQPALFAKFWPPWPFDRLGNRGTSENERLSGSDANVNNPSIVWVRRVLVIVFVPSMLDLISAL